MYVDYLDFFWKDFTRIFFITFAFFNPHKLIRNVVQAIVKTILLCILHYKYNLHNKLVLFQHIGSIYLKKMNKNVFKLIKKIIVVKWTFEFSQIRTIICRKKTYLKTNFLTYTFLILRILFIGGSTK